MSDSRSMYQENILEHYKSPQNFGELPAATHQHRGHNPLCGDDFMMQLVIRDERVAEVKFTGVGCAISTAAASMLTEEIKGKSVEEVQAMTKDDVLALLGIEIGPVRLKCALLPLETLQGALCAKG